MRDNLEEMSVIRIVTLIDDVDLSLHSSDIKPSDTNYYNPKCLKIDTIHLSTMFYTTTSDILYIEHTEKSLFHCSASHKIDGGHTA